MTSYYTEAGDLHDYRTGELLRPATEDEIRASDEAARIDGGAGVIGEDELSYSPTGLRCACGRLTGVVLREVRADESRALGGRA